jgi:glutamyl-tRNA reductase
VARFQEWLASLDVVPTISALRRRADEVVEQVLRENESRWESLSAADRERVEVMARAVVSRLLHEPTVRLKDRSSYHYLHTIRELFALDAVEAEVVPLRDSTRHAR